jgi:hypothetical protein
VRSLAVLLLVVACSKPQPPPHAPGPPLVMTAPDAALPDAEPIAMISGPERMIDGLYYVVEGSPDPLACHNDRDCIGDTVTDETGCCVRETESFAQTWAWHAWVTRRRLSQDCDGVTCPPLPVGAMPQLCRLDVRCASGRCVDACDQQPDAGP